ncbi:hypothetical protein H4CHR_02989 [Variovorax sp. PBS-H4]|uniref:hypothetical protein n=1 Tax=Variovorax sp. PBS-H4 TaxID=434008 RepID=UPI001317346A|nr:hypothetical protein [Variovorax sp. PBS-H4]VTU32327.1 hypothetical protein H4CHR_02989 [Variovorax sp. PBS-H4]
MTHIFADRVLELCNVSGTNDAAVIGAVSGYRTLSSAVSNNDTIHYMIQEVDVGGRPSGAWEVGRGSYNAGSVTRTTVIASSTGSKISFSAGTIKQLALTVAAPSIPAVAGDWRSALGAVAKAGDTLTGPLNFAPPVNLAAAGTTDLSTALSNVINITGSATINSFGILAAGATRRLVFAGTPTINSSGGATRLPGGVASISVAAGDTAELMSLGGGSWAVTNYTRAAGFGEVIASAPTLASVMALLRASDQPTYRNLLINGDIRLNQEVAVSVTGHGTFPVDGWQIANASTARITAAQQVTSAFQGFLTSLRATVTTAGAPGAGDLHAFIQGVEGYATGRLGWGTSGALGVWVSGYFRSSVPGTYAISMRNAAQNRSYVAPLVINNANTTEYKSWFIPGDTAGTWANGSSVGMYLTVALAVGSTYQTATTNAWQAGNFLGITGQTQLTSTNGATFEMTGVQNEPSYLSAYEALPFDISLQRARRYWQSSYAYGFTPGTNVDSLGNAYRGFAIGSNDLVAFAPFPVEMRAAPSVVLYSPGNGAASNVRRVANGANQPLSAGMSAGARGMYACQGGGGFVSGELYDFHYVANARI